MERKGSSCTIFCMIEHCFFYKNKRRPILCHIRDVGWLCLLSYLFRAFFFAGQGLKNLDYFALCTFFLSFCCSIAKSDLDSGDVMQSCGLAFLA